MAVVTAHMVYFCAFARSEIFPKYAWKSGVGRGQFDAGVNGLNSLLNVVFLPLTHFQKANHCFFYHRQKCQLSLLDNLETFVLSC